MDKDISPASGPAQALPDSKARLTALRAELARRDLDGFVVPLADEHQGEYVPPSAQRLAWLTGFTGSAGTAVVLAAKAVIVVDGRYTLQVRDQVDGRLYDYGHITEAPLEAWLEAHLPKGARVGFDPWLHTPDQVARLDAQCRKAGGTLQACDGNPVDAVWHDRPAPPDQPFEVYDDALAGRTSVEKRKDLTAEMTRHGIDAQFLSSPDSIAWLLNIRGRDVEFSPLPLSFVLLAKDGTAKLFARPGKVGPALAKSLAQQGIAVRDQSDLGAELIALGLAKAKLSLDPASAPQWVLDRAAKAGAVIERAPDPCVLPKARKNPTELAGIQAAHRRDGRALVRFLAWLATEAAGGKVTELAAARRLDAFRAEEELFVEPSFPTISGAGPNGAIVHYRVSPESDRALTPGTLYLVDSGGQYRDGTTDVTRTVAIGQPSAEMRDRFTRVLKGHIAVSTAVFPAGTSGSQLDALARGALWQAGLDYDHGTGHGVGHFLSVHEGPQRISKLPNRVGLEPGMVISNEPGYYKAGAYGIRIENLVVVDGPRRIDGGERDMYGFSPLTLAPIDRHLVEIGLLSEAERGWLNAYHRTVFEALSPRLSTAERAWLEAATAPL